MKNPLLLILIFSTLAQADHLAFLDSTSVEAKILDTAGCSVKIEREGKIRSIDKSKLVYVMYHSDMIVYRDFVCTEDMKKMELQGAAPSKDSLKNETGRDKGMGGSPPGTIQLVQSSEMGYSAPMMGANGMWMGGGPSVHKVDFFEVSGDRWRVGYLGESLKPYLNPTSDARKYLGYYQEQKIGAIGCYAGSFIMLLVAMYAGQDDAGSSYGYNPQTGWGEQKNTRINSTFAPGITGSCIFLVTGLVLQFTARMQLEKAVKIHNESLEK